MTNVPIGKNTMLIFDPRDPSFIWWRAMINHIKNAKRFPEQAGGYCRAAVIARMEYECLTAQRMAKYE